MARELRFKTSSDLSIVSIRPSTARLRRRKSSTTQVGTRWSLPFTNQAASQEREKLIAVEAQRVIAVLDDAIQSLQIVARIPAICNDYDYFASCLGSETIQAFQTLCTCLGFSSYRPEDRNRPHTSTAIRDAEFVDSMKDMAPPLRYAMYSTNTMRRIRDHVKVVVGIFLKNSSAFNIVCRDTTPSDSVMELISNLKQLRKFVYERLMTTEAEDLEQIAFLDSAPERELEYLAEIEKLSNELNDLKNSSDIQLNDLKEKIGRLEDDIEKMVTISSEAILQKRLDTINEMEMEEKTKEKEKTALDEEYLVMNAQYVRQLNTHREAEMILRKRNFKISTEVENWVKKYDNDMTEKLNFFESVSAEYAKEKADLEKIEEEFAPIEKEYMTLMKERAEAEALRISLLEQERLQTAAVIIIQKYCRGWLARQLFFRLKVKARRKNNVRTKKSEKPEKVNLQTAKKKMKK